MSIRKGETITEVQICAEIIPWQLDPCVSASLPTLLAARIEKICVPGAERSMWWDVRQLGEGKVALVVPLDLL